MKGALTLSLFGDALFEAAALMPIGHLSEHLDDHLHLAARFAARRGERTIKGPHTQITSSVSQHAVWAHEQGQA